MSKKTMWNRRNIPFCADPENYVLVETKEGIHWRKKRVKGKVNEVFSVNADLSRISGPAAKRVVQRLKPFFSGLDTGRITLRISNSLRSSLKQKTVMDFASLDGMEFQRDHQLDCLLLAPYKIEIDNSFVKVNLVVNSYCVKRQNDLATHFYFEAVLLSGDPSLENSLKIESTESKLFDFKKMDEEECVLSLALPQANIPWMMMLKVSCLEGREIAVHPKHYGMKVIKAG